MLKKIKVRGVYGVGNFEALHSECVYLGKNGRLYAKFGQIGWMTKGLKNTCWHSMSEMSIFEYILFRLGCYDVL